MKKNSITFTIFHITLVASVFFWVFQMRNYVFTDTVKQKTPHSELLSTESNISNATRFQSAYSSQFWVIGVALSTRIGMTYSELWDNNISNRRFYTGINSMPNSASSRRQVRQTLLEENMLLIREYYNISQTDIIETLKTSSDRARTLDNFVHQIELRRQWAETSIENLQAQRQIYIRELENITRTANTERNTLEREFSKWNARETLQTSDRFISLRSLQTELESDLVYMNQFIRQYAFLNDYNRSIINTLKVNRQQIINRDFIVIPESGNEFLRPLELIFDERDMQR